MSEQTPGSMSEHEPSMEDILASIRKIIAEDAPAEPEGALQGITDDGSVGAMDLDMSDVAPQSAPASLSGIAAFETDDVAAFDLGGADIDGEIDDESTQSLMDSVDFDLSEDLVPADDLASTDSDVLDLTDMLDDPGIALTGDGSPVEDLPDLKIESVDDSSFDEMMDLVVEADDGAVNVDDDMADIFSEIDALGEADVLDGLDGGLDLDDVSAVDELAQAASPEDALPEDVSPVGAGLGAQLGAGLAGLGALGAGVAAVVSAKAEDIAPQSGSADDLMSDMVDFDLEDLTAQSSDVLDDNSQMLDMSAFDMDETDISIETEQVVDPAAHLLAEPSALDSAEDDDIDLVKSLMAELTDDSFEDDNLQVSNLETTDLEDVFEVSLDDADDADIVSELSTSEPVSDDLADIIAEAQADADAAAQRVEAARTQDVVTDDAAIDDLNDILELYSDDIEAEGLGDVMGDIDTASADADESNDLVSGGLIAAALAGGAALAASSDENDVEAEMSDALLSDILLGEDADSADEPETNDDTNLDLTNMAPEELEADLNDEIIEDGSMPHIVKTETVASKETSVAASGAFASLNKVVEEKTVESESGPRIGDLVQEALKPMLQEWLDKNLKGIVDRAVAKEIKRISSGK